MTSLALYGCGRMGAAMLRGWIAAGRAGDAVVFDPDAANPALEEVAAAGVRVNPDPLTVGPAATIVLAVKPQTFTAGKVDPAALIGPSTLVLSIMAGITLSRLASVTRAPAAARAMPNTPAAIGRGVTTWVAGAGIDADRRTEVEALLRPLGSVIELPTEKALDAATAVAGCGPAYVFLLTEAMAAAGEAEGLDPALALRLARETVSGAGALMDAVSETPGELRRAVTSPQGVTAAAIDVLVDAGGMPALLRKAITKAVARSRELGQ